MSTSSDEATLLIEIRDLQIRLNSAKARLARRSSDARLIEGASVPTVCQSSTPEILTNLHNLFLLSDSSLPLGSFALSVGLESYIAHQAKSSYTQSLPRFQHFLGLSLASVASTGLPYVLAAYCHPENLEQLDNDLDASTACAVARRASLAQGRALAAVWERSFKTVTATDQTTPNVLAARDALERWCQSLRLSKSTNEIQYCSEDCFQPRMFMSNGHLAPSMGVLCVALSLSLDHTLYLYLVAHAKMLLSAGIRASLLGPYQAHSILAGDWLKNMVSKLAKREAVTTTDTAAQPVPMLDIWSGRHDLIYSRIFNS